MPLIGLSDVRQRWMLLLHHHHSTQSLLFIFICKNHHCGRPGEVVIVTSTRGLLCPASQEAPHSLCCWVMTSHWACQERFPGWSKEPGGDDKGRKSVEIKGGTNCSIVFSRGYRGIKVAARVVLRTQRRPRGSLYRYHSILLLAECGMNISDLPINHYICICTLMCRL